MAVLLLASLLFAFLVGASPPAAAAPGDAVANPGPFTFVASTAFLDIGGHHLDLPGVASVAECNNGVNDDVAIDTGAVAQDLNVDFDGGASHGAPTPTAPDAQCVASPVGFPASKDMSEAKAGFQLYKDLSIRGTGAADGSLAIPAASVVMPTVSRYVASLAGVADIGLNATGPGTGVIDPLSGAFDLDLDLRLRLVHGATDCSAPFHAALTAWEDPLKTSGPIDVFPSPYALGSIGNGNFSGVAGVGNNRLVIPAAQPTTGATTQAACDTLSAALGLPTSASLPPSTPPGTAALKIAGSLDRFNGNHVFLPEAQTKLYGEVLDATTFAPVEGVVVTLVEQWPSWTIAATTVTDRLGHYQFADPPTGPFAVRYFDPSGAHARQWFTNRATYKDALPVAPIQATDQGQTRAFLAAAPTGRIAGDALALDPITADPSGVPGVRVLVFDATRSEYVAGGETGANGSYSVGGLVPGDYKVWFVDPLHRYRSQWYHFKLLGPQATPVTVGAGTTWASAILGTT